MIPLSVLDLAPILEGGDAAQSFRNSLDLAQHAERLGYRRFWLAEHHNIPSVASAATSVLIAHVAGGTSTIRVGAGGIMLPNHPPLVIAEQFGTLASLFPGGSISGSAARPDPIRSRRAHFAAHRPPATRSRRTCSSYGVLPAGGARTGRPRGARRGARGADLDSRIEHVRRAARGRARTAVRVRVALRADDARAGDRRSTASSFSPRNSCRSLT